MSDMNIEVESGSSVRLLTKYKWCDRDIVVTAVAPGPKTITWDGNTEGLQTYNSEFKISDFIPDFTKYDMKAVACLHIDSDYGDYDSDYDVSIQKNGDSWYGAVIDMTSFTIYPSDHESGGGIFTYHSANDGYYIKSITFTPKTESGGSDSNDCYKGNGVWQWDGNTEGRTSAIFDSNPYYTFYKVSDTAPYWTDIEGCPYDVAVDTRQYDGLYVWSSNYLGFATIDSMDYSTVVIIVPPEQGTGYEPGMYFLHTGDDNYVAQVIFSHYDG